VHIITSPCHQELDPSPSAAAASYTHALFVVVMSTARASAGSSGYLSITQGKVLHCPSFLGGDIICIGGACWLPLLDLVVGLMISGVVGSGISCMVCMEILVLDSFCSRSVPAGRTRLISGFHHTLQVWDLLFV
jgi:hypothetical protein